MKIKRYDSFMGIKIKEQEKARIELLAAKANIHISELVRDCIQCLLVNKSCNVRRRRKL